MFAGAILLAATCSPSARPAPLPTLRLSIRDGAFFIQDNLVYSRLLQLQPGGAYRQIDVDRSSSEETDRGTWEQDVRGDILLHPTGDGLRFRALFSGPLTIVLDRPGVLQILPVLAGQIRRFLAQSGDDVFARADAAEITGGVALPDSLSIDPAAETFSRTDLTSLAHQVDDLLWSERANTYILSPVPNASPTLLVLQDARFQAPDLPAVRQEYRVKAGDAPPFYFARVSAGTFARRAGRWKVLRSFGQPN